MYCRIKPVKIGLSVDNLFNRRYLNTALTDTDYFGNPFVRGGADVTF